MSAAARVTHRWERLDDAALLRLRFSDLGLRISGSPVHDEALRLGEQLERRGIRFKPHLWFSTDWFSPDGVPGIAVPFFLGPPAPSAPRAPHAGRSGRQQPALAATHPEARARSCGRHRVRAAPPSRLATSLRPRRGALLPRLRRLGPGARTTCCISSTGMRRVIRPRTLPRRSPFGCNRKRAGGATTPAGRRSPSSNSSTGSWPSSPAARRRSVTAPS